MATQIAGIDTRALKSYVMRVVALHVERAEINDSIKEVYEEAKEAGIVTKHLRTVVREEMMETEEREAQYATLDSYRRALGLLAGTPLGEAAMARAEAEAAPDGPVDDGGGPGVVRNLRRGPGRPRKVQPAAAENGGGAEIGEPVGAA